MGKASYKYRPHNLLRARLSTLLKSSTVHEQLGFNFCKVKIYLTILLYHIL